MDMGGDCCRLWDDENVLKLVVMATQLADIPKIIKMNVHLKGIISGVNYISNC